MIEVKKQQLQFLNILRLIVKSLFSQYKWRFIGVLFVAALAGGLQTLTPKILQQIIDLLLAGTKTLSEFWWLLPIYLFVYLGAAYFDFISGRIVYYLAMKIEDYWRFRALHHYFQLPLSWHDQHESGEIGSRIDRAGSAIFSIIAELFGHNIIVSLFTLLFILIFTFTQAPLVGLIFLLPLPLYGLVTYVLSMRIAKGQVKLNKLADRAQRTLFDATGNIRTVKSFGKEQEEVALYARRWTSYHDSDYEVERLWLRQSIFQTTIEAISRVLLLAYCVYSFVKGTLSVGQIVMFLSYQQLSFSPLALLTYIFTRVRRLVKRASQLFKIAAEPDPMADIEDAVTLPVLREGITFNHVTFRYHGKVHALKDLTFSLNKGKTVALVGRSGAGKSTIAVLALRFYDPDEGAILWDGIDIKKATRKSLRERISYIPQDSVLFNRSIYDNIAYGTKHAT
ncbi:MAG: ABC transporter ATP-binding protein, partial [Nanoarchaeota archaeon]